MKLYFTITILTIFQFIYLIYTEELICKKSYDYQKIHEIAKELDKSNDKNSTEGIKYFLYFKSNDKIIEKLEKYRNYSDDLNTIIDFIDNEDLDEFLKEQEKGDDQIDPEQIKEMTDQLDRLYPVIDFFFLNNYEQFKPQLKEYASIIRLYETTKCTCPDGQYVTENQKECQKCQEGCKTCEYDKCLICDDNYKLSANKQCIKNDSTTNSNATSSTNLKNGTDTNNPKNTTNTTSTEKNNTNTDTNQNKNNTSSSTNNDIGKDENNTNTNTTSSSNTTSSNSTDQNSQTTAISEIYIKDLKPQVINLNKAKTIKELNDTFNNCSSHQQDTSKYDKLPETFEDYQQQTAQCLLNDLIQLSHYSNQKINYQDIFETCELMLQSNLYSSSQISQIQSLIFSNKQLNFIYNNNEISEGIKLIDQINKQKFKNSKSADQLKIFMTNSQSISLEFENLIQSYIQNSNQSLITVEAQNFSLHLQKITKQQIFDVLGTESDLDIDKISIKIDQKNIESLSEDLDKLEQSTENLNLVLMSNIQILDEPNQKKNETLFKFEIFYLDEDNQLNRITNDKIEYQIIFPIGNLQLNKTQNPQSLQQQFCKIQDYDDWASQNVKILNNNKQVSCSAFLTTKTYLLEDKIVVIDEAKMHRPHNPLLIIGIAVVCVLILGLIIFFIRRERKKKKYFQI